MGGSWWQDLLGKVRRLAARWLRGRGKDGPMMRDEPSDPAFDPEHAEAVTPTPEDDQAEATAEDDPDAGHGPDPAGYDQEDDPG